MRAKRTQDQLPAKNESGTKAATALPEDVDADRQPAPECLNTHLKVVELATQLACAQLGAEASMESSRLTVSGIQRIAAAYVMASARMKSDLENLRTNPELIDAAFVGRAYADLLGAAEVQERAIDKAIPLSHPNHDELFEGALLRAKCMLRPSSEDTSLVHAEQLFDAEEVLSESRIYERFKECEWPGFRNRESLTEFMILVQKWFHDHLCRIHSPEEDEQFADDAKAMKYLLDLGRRRCNNDLFRGIYEFVRDHKPPNQPRSRWTSTEELSHAVWTKCLIEVIFCGCQPEKIRPKKKKRERRYYPWGLFRFLRIHGEGDHQGSRLLKSLSRERRQLSFNAEVYPLNQNYPYSYDFGPLDKLVMGREDEMMRRDGVQHAVNPQPSAALVDKVQTIEMLTGQINQNFQNEVIEQARSGGSFEPKWTEAIKKGFHDLLLAGNDRPMEHISDFLTKFYLPLLDAYGAFRRIRQWSAARHDLLEVIDLFPGGWDLSFAETDQSAQPGPAITEEGKKTRKSKAPKSMQTQKAITVTLRNRVGEKRDFVFYMDISHAESNTG